MRTVWVIRHAQSYANLPQEAGASEPVDLAFANRTSKLTPRGIRECGELKPVLSKEYGIVPHKTPAAISTFVRTRETATLLGFKKLKDYSQLDEVEHGMDIEVLRAMIRKGNIPEVAMRTARKTLEDPPREDVWVAHGLLIAGLCIELGIERQFKRKNPGHCEVRQLTL